jgi:hypothetical protein
MLISEVFGFGVSDFSPAAREARRTHNCPFRQSKCTKSSKTDPIGICSLASGDEAAAICPVRFLEGGRIFRDAALLALGAGVSFAVFPEIRILRVGNDRDEAAKKIGKVDFLIGKIDDGRVSDFAAIEVQASYFSGTSIRPALKKFLLEEALDPEISGRRPDFRSSAQKRLMPQLQLKVPVFRRWGKKFFVVVDSQFFGALPTIKPSSLTNSELIWLNYPIRKSGDSYMMQDPEVVGTQWEDVLTSLREGQAPERDEILLELQQKLDSTKGQYPIFKS